ncbi:hypothetical protein AUC43_14150 [Hymenobacter sedentarius]|uniref:Uncharacterized protein n=1 Tax=Hymenobacter sedentarius TaxID=1411621 RepID=A0A0U3SJ13_9BACT|nr:hypothetical protein AUC43_14150 [Hymenobacter sedentarius]
MTNKLLIIASPPTASSRVQRTPPQPKSRFFLVLSLLSALSGFTLSPALGQADVVTPDSPLPRLLRERGVLTRRYAVASAQRHSLFGNKPSKKDLQEVVDALQGIVDKDQQIVDVLNQTARKAQTTSVRLAATTTTLESTGRDDRNLTAQRLSELQNEIENVRQREKQQLAKQRDLQAEVADVKEGQFVRDALIAFLTVLSIGLMVALWRKK